MVACGLMAEGHGAAYGPWDIERGEGAVGRPQEAVSHEACVNVETRDRPRRVDGLRHCGAIDGAWGIERGEGAVGSPQEAVIHEACVKVGSRDRPGRVDGSDRPMCRFDA